MYVASPTWLNGPAAVAPPAAPARPRVAPRVRGCGGLGGPWVFSVSPGDSCYDPSHSPGETHYRLWFPGMSAAESSCISGSTPGSTGQAAIVLSNPAVLTPGLPVGFDPTTGAITDNTTGETQSQGPYASAFSALVPPTPAPQSPLADFLSQYGLWILGGVAAFAVFAAVKR